MTPTATGPAAPPPRSAQPPLVQLYSHSAAPGAAGDAHAELRAAIVAGLRAQPQYTTPGSAAADRAYAFRRTMPTTVMYSEKGLQLYDELVEEPEYYLWSAELEILSTHAPEIALRAFGHATPGTSKLCARYTPPKSLAAAASSPWEEAPHDEQERNGRKNGFPLPLDRAKEKWGDQRVGKHNGGVNGEEGLDGKRTVGCASLVELGAGSLRKTAHLVRALQHLPESADAGQPAVQYYALDLDRAELVRTLEDLHRQEAAPDSRDAAQWTVCGGKVGINGMHATYDQGLAHIGAGGLPSDGPRCLLWLGSSIGNFDRRGAAEFLKDAAQSALRPGDTMLISIDRRNKPEEVAAAYNDANGKTREFILEGLRHADAVLGGGVLDVGKFEYHDRYNAVEGRHESYYRSTVAQRIEVPGEEPIDIDAGELIHCESSYKFSERETFDTFDYAGLRVVQRWTDTAQRYDVWLVERPAVHFLSTQPTGLIKEPTLQASSWGLPTREDWARTWRAWDIVTLTMIPGEMLHEKPIDLRHKCIFYIGHIPAFLDLTLSRNLDEPHTHEPYSLIFERGVDPHMDDGEDDGDAAAPANGDTITINGKQVYCHAHSKVPDKDEDWPTLPELLAYKAKVVARVDAIYDDIASGRRTLDRRLARTLWMTLEHKALHMETLLYMLLQSDKTLPPAGFMPPDWATLQRDWDAADARQGGQRAREQLVSFDKAEVVLGHADDDAKDFDTKASRASSDVADLNEQLGRPEFGWDNETQRPAVQSDAFAISAAPISNGQYLAYLEATPSTAVPASWDLPAGADIADARVRTLYGAVQMSVAHLWPVQASGKELAAYCAWKGGRLPTHVELRRFLDAAANCTDRPGANVGFRNWTPVPAQLPRTDHDGHTLPGHNGGVWEWTSSKFDNYDGFRPSALYPAYSADFFDGKHNVLLGGSWATTPSIAGRRTVVNTYQFAYPYVFAGARVAFDQA